jgi:TP901 family phage tail tape measure protein
VSEQFLAEAQILITPDTAGFRTQLIKELEAAQKGITVKVLIAPDPKGFRAKLQEAVTTSARGITAKVLVRPDMKGFRTALQAEVASAAKGITVPVTPTAARTTRGAAAQVTTGGIVDKSLAQAQLAVTAAANTGIAARRKLTGELTKEERAAIRVTRTELQLKTAQDAVTKSLRTGNAALIAQATELDRVAAAAHRAAVAAQERLTTGAPTGVVANQAAAREAEKAAEADLIAAKETTAKQFEAIEAEQTAALERAVAQREAFYAKEVADAKAAATQISATQKQQSASLLTARRKDDLAAERAFDKQIAARKTAAEATQRAAAQLAGVSTFTPRFTEVTIPPDAIPATQRLATATNTLRAAKATLAHVDDVVLEAERAFEATLLTTNRTMQSAAAETLVLAREQQVLADAAVEAAAALNAEAKAAEKAALAARAQGAATRSSVSKALIAQTAQLVGLRGAALSANVAFIAAAASVIGFAASLVQFAKFQSTLNVFRVTASATADQMKAVREQAEALGRDITLPGVGAQDAAESMTELSKAGLSVQDSLAGARGVLQLATAAAIDNAQATELAASALNAFGLSGDQAVHVADVLTNAANDAQGSIVDIGIALQQSAAVGRQAGLSLEQTVSALTLLARSGLRGSDAGTSLRTALIRLINPTSKASKEIEKLGLHVRTATGAINLDVFDEFARKTRNLTAAQRDQSLAIIFGQDAIRAAAILAREGSSALDAETNSINKSGSAAKLAGARMTGLSGDVENLKNQMAATGLIVGDLAAKVAGPLVRGFTNFFISMQQIASTIDAIAEGVGRFVHGEQFDVAGKSLHDLTNEALKFQEALSEGGDPAFVPAFLKGLETVENALGEAGRKVVQQGGFSQVVREFSTLSPQIKKAMEDNVISPGEQAELQASAIGRAFLLAISPVREAFDNVGATARSAVEDASAQVKLGAPRLGRAFKDAIEEASAQAKIDALKAGQEMGDKIVFGIEQSLKLAKDKLNSAFGSIGRQARLTLGRLQSQALDLDIQGASPQARLKNAKAQEKAAQTALDVGTARQLPRAELDKRKQTLIDAQNLAKGINEEIAQNAEDAANKAKAQAKKIKDARDAADQAILDAFSGRRTELDVAATNAAGTKTLQDDLKIKVALANQISKEIKIIGDTVKDQKTRRDQIAARVKELASVGVDIDTLRQQMVDNAEEQAQTQFETRLSLAQGSGAPLQVLLRIFDQRIAGLNKAIAKAKEEKRSTDVLRGELQDVTNTRRQTIDDFLAKQTELAKLTFGDTSNKSPIITALNKEIANKRKEIAQAKKAHKATIDLRIQLQQLINDRKEILNDAKSSSQDPTTAFDLLTEFNAKFNDIAGNAITPNQPFAGSSAFSTDIVNKGIAGFAQTGLPHRPIDIRLRGDDQQSKQLTATEELIAVIRENTEVIRGGGGNRSTVSVAVPGEIAGKNKLAAFWAARTARDVKDG